MFTLKSILGLSLIVAPTLVAGFEDIYFGSYSGEGLGGTWSWSAINPTNFNGPNFCHMPIPGLPDGYELDRNGGDCPSDDEAADGVWYADIIDKNNGNVKVGRCVYEYQKGPNCASTGSFLTNRFIHCYPDA
ncbi:hypothetical protein CNMCM5878_009236 [Aspergillus fumigatiaffinis]|nr:hypothetical protein CNMCM5878_009236 [Aspergillus fumigatiaffinis]